MIKGKIREFLEYILWGSRTKKLSLRRQMTRVITLCCIGTVTIQAVVILAMVLNQYISQEKEDTLYILESDNAKMNNAIQYLEEMVLSIQHNSEVKSFLSSQIYRRESSVQQLKIVANLFSERNRLSSQEPLVEKVYLFRPTGECIYNLYYPTIVTQIEKNTKKYSGMNRQFSEQTKAFYYVVEEKYVNLCLKLYDEGMDTMGTCILVLNKSAMEESYSNVEKMKQHGWAISQEEEVILGGGSLEILNTSILENTLRTGFGLTLKAAVSPWQVYSSLGVTMAIVIAISVGGILSSSLIAYMIARRFVHPLETVAEKIKLVGKGDFDTKLGEYSAEELNNISEKFNEMTDYIKVLVNEVYETQLIAKQAQIQYLQAQMNPHFLFNVLSMIEMKAAINQDTEVQQMIFKLSKLYQGKIFRKNEYFIRLTEELEIVEFYLSLQNSRFGDKITYSIEYDQDKQAYDQFLIPRLSIEPSVENAVCHGLEPKQENGYISVRIFLQNEERLCVTIEDDGVGFDPELLEGQADDPRHSHVGINNTDRMIKNLYGEEYGMQIISSPGKGTRVKIELPIKMIQEQ